MIFNRIKLNYNIKLLDDLFKNQDYQAIYKHLRDLKSNKSVNYEIIKYAYNKYLLLNEHRPFHRNKFFWIISYELEDVNFLNSFIDFYMSKQEGISFKVDSHKNLFEKLFSIYGADYFPSSPSFEDIIENSGFYQQLILLSENKDFIFASTNAAFFEAQNQKFLIYPQNSCAYIYIVQDPLKLYSRYKYTGLNSQEALNNIINHFDDPRLNNGKYFLYENRQNWQTNVNSWNDENVKNSYRGKTIKYEDLMNKTEETLIDVIYHIKQTGVNINVEYKIIEDFLNNNQIPFENNNDQFSNKEAKSIYNNIDRNLLKEFDYNIVD